MQSKLHLAHDAIAEVHVSMCEYSAALRCYQQVLAVQPEEAALGAEHEATCRTAAALTAECKKEDGRHYTLVGWSWG